MSRNALPDHLKDRLHDDWWWIFKKIPRSWTAFKFFQPPNMLLGYNVKRWDMPGDIATLNNYDYGKGLLIGFQSTTHGANAIQKILGRWKISFHVTFPLSFHFTIKLWNKSMLNSNDIERPEQGYDGVHLIYGRIGFRWDSFDKYYNLGAFIGTTYN